MSTLLLAPLRIRRGRHAARPRPRAVDALAGAAGLGLGAVVGLALTAEPAGSLAAPGGALTFAGRITGLVGAYAMLITVLLAARLPALERTLGQDRLLALHRRLAPWSLVLIVAHGVLTVLGCAQRSAQSPAAELWTVLTMLPGVLAAIAGSALLVTAGVTSARAARRRMAHETWWAVHLYTYLGLALSFVHQIATGASFVGHPVARGAWIAAWAGTAGVALGYRVLLPLWRSARHRLRVTDVVHEAPGVVSLIVRGHDLDRLPVSGGQYFNWRFLRRGLWWQAHPYSISALPADGAMRVTVKDLGDHSRALARLRPGTRIAIEGPYGAFTSDHARSRRVAIIAAGVGATPARALLEDLARASRPAVVLRARRPEELILHDEIARLASERGGQMLALVGSREVVPLDAQALTQIIPDVADRDVFVCGPPAFMDRVLDAARAAGVPADRCHHERFDL